MRRVVWLALLAGIGCAHQPRPHADASELVWIAKHYAGGVSCQADSGYEVPNTVAILRRSGVDVYASVREGVVGPDSCDSPAYTAIHYALIAERDRPAEDLFRDGLQIGPPANAGTSYKPGPRVAFPDTARAYRFTAGRGDKSSHPRHSRSY